MNSAGMNNEISGPLFGIKVLDLTHHLAGPTCGLMLADLGAEVVKIEKIPDGDDTRRSIPPEINGESAAFMMMNRNKSGIALDLKTEAGKGILCRLVKDADILIENFRPGTLDRLGVGYQVLKKHNPSILYGVISGFGLTGPYHGLGGFDLIAQGFSGLMSVTGEADSEKPTKIGVPITDISAGLLLTIGILAGLHEREKTGLGQIIDTSLFEAGITNTFWQSAIALSTGVAPSAMGSRHPLNAPYQAFRTADSWICIGAASERNWLRLMALLKNRDISEDPRFSDNSERMANIESLDKKLSEIFLGATTNEWLKRCEIFGIPAGPIYNITEMHSDPQTKHRAMTVEVDHPIAGIVKTLGSPIKLSRTPASVRSASPIYGQHTRQILQQNGYSSSEIAMFIEEGVVVSNDVPEK